MNMNKRDPYNFLEGANSKAEIKTRVKKWLERKQQICFSTQGYAKLWNYFCAVINTNIVQRKINELRKSFGVPDNFFQDGIYYRATPALRKLFSEKSNKKLKNEFKSICKEYSLHYMDWYLVLEHYFYTNKLEQIAEINSFNLCLISDLVKEKTKPISKEFTESDDMAFPIAIRISPYASKRDILDYVEKQYPTINEFQDLYRNNEIKIGKIKNKKPQITERNKIVYNNKDKPIKEIRKILAKNNYFLDDGHIGKIISLENKRRKNM